MTCLISRTACVALVAVVLILAPGVAAAQEVAKAGPYANEDRDWNVRPTNKLRTTDYHAPTPVELPGGRVVSTQELSRMLAGPRRPYVIDVLGGTAHRTIAGAFWMSGAGAGDMSKAEAAQFETALAGFAGGDRGRPIVFFCVDAECWLSYNAALRAIAAGYTNVMWYRGGVAAWRRAGLDMSMSEPFAWKTE